MHISAEDLRRLAIELDAIEFAAEQTGEDAVMVVVENGGRNPRIASLAKRVAAKVNQWAINAERDEARAMLREPQ